MKRTILILAALAASILTGCTTAAVAWEAAAADQIRAVNDNAVHVWMQSGCALPVGAILRNPQTIDTLNKFCGGGTTSLGTGQPINITVQVPSQAASGAK
jgi:hypothetical protein